MQFSLDNYSHTKFEVTLNDFLTTFTHFFPKFSSILLCWDPRTANPHFALENWPKGGWGLRKVLKNLCPKIWDWVFWHQNLFFFQILIWLDFEFFDWSYYCHIQMTRNKNQFDQQKFIWAHNEQNRFKYCPINWNQPRESKYFWSFWS